MSRGLGGGGVRNCHVPFHFLLELIRKIHVALNYCRIYVSLTGANIFNKCLSSFDFSVLSLHKIIHFAKNKIGVVYFQCCVIFDTL